MHVSSKEVVVDEKKAKELGVELGVHIITDVLEADGATALASPEAKLSASVISVQRTDSGGVQVQVALSISEPVIVPPVVEEAPPVPTADEQAQAYLESKGMDASAAKAALEKFGALAILRKRQKGLDAELDSLCQI